MESFGATLKRRCHEVCHHFSPKHLDRYVTEFQGHNNIHPIETAERMATTTARTVETHLPHASLIGPKRTRQLSML